MAIDKDRMQHHPVGSTERVSFRHSQPSLRCTGLTRHSQLALFESASQYQRRASEGAAAFLAMDYTASEAALLECCHAYRCGPDRFLAEFDAIREAAEHGVEV